MSTITFDQPSTANVSSSQDALSVTNAGTGPALRGESTSGFTAIYGTSSHNGIFGETGSQVDHEGGVVGKNNGKGKGVLGLGTNGERGKRQRVHGRVWHV
jgi:hypothetical protein